MSGILFDEIVFGPVISRRLGVSLGINLMPLTNKLCTFNCIYCECGWTEDDEHDNKLPRSEEVKNALRNKLAELKNSNQEIDSITFAGNGEPTLHPAFAEIVDITVALRDEYFKDAKITLLSNSSMLHKADILKALQKIDNNVLKLDAGTEQTFQLVNKARNEIKLSDIVDNLKKFEGNLIIQTLFIRGEFEGSKIDNTTEEELFFWLKHISEINPKLVMIYPADRDTPAENLEKISQEELKTIAEKVEKLGIKTEVY